jgi:O-antigen/teichoic acid export membrane protein
MSRTNRFLSGIGFGYATQVLTTLVSLWLVPFLLTRVGQHDYGLWLVGTQLLFYLALLDLGVVALLPRETAFATGRAGGVVESAELPLLVGQTVRLVLWQMPLVALAAVIAWFLLPAEWQGLSQPLALVLLVFVLAFPLRIFGAVLNGLQDLGFLGCLGIVSYMVSTAATVTLVLAGWGLYALAVGWALMQLINAGASWYRLRTRFPTVLPAGMPELVWAATRGRLKSGFWVSLNQVGQVFLTGTDMLIIGKLFGPAAVVPYVCTGKLIGVLANQPQMLMAAASPALSQMRTGESRERLAGVCTALGQAMLMVSGAVVCLVLVVNQGFVGRWVGAGQYGGFWLTVALLVSMLLRHWNLTVGYILFCFGYERRLCLTALLDGCVTLCAAVVLSRRLGLIGVPLGSVVGVCLVSLTGNVSALAGANAMPVARLLRSLAPWFWRFALLALASALLARHFVPDTVPALAAVTLLVGCAYLLVMLPLTRRDPLGVYVRPRLSLVRVRFFRALGLTRPA